MRKVLVAIAFFVAFPLLLAQQTLNNDSVIKMVKMGFPENMIVNAINQSPGTYDTSPPGLAAVKNAGVGDKAVAAMVAKETTPVQPSAPGLPATTSPGANTAFAASTARPATQADVAEIIKLAGAGFSDELVIQQVKIEGKTPLLFTAEQRSNFARSGVDDAIINVSRSGNGFVLPICPAAESP